MARKRNTNPDIRWRQKDTDLIERTIKNFNAKIYRVNKRGNADEINALPQKANKADAISKIKTRKDFDRYIASLQRFSERGAEKVVKTDRGAKISKWSADERERMQREVNRIRARKEKELGGKPVTIGGKSTGHTRAEVGTVKEQKTKPSTLKTHNMSQKEFEINFMALERELYGGYKNASNKRFMENYIRGLITEGFSEELQQMIVSIPMEKFLEIMDTDETAHIGFIYDPQEREVIEEYIRDAYEKYATVKTDKDGNEQYVNVNGIDINNLGEEVRYNLWHIDRTEDTELFTRYQHLTKDQREFRHKKKK